MTDTPNWFVSGTQKLGMKKSKDKAALEQAINQNQSDSDIGTTNTRNTNVDDDDPPAWMVTGKMKAEQKKAPKASPKKQKNEVDPEGGYGTMPSIQDDSDKPSWFSSGKNKKNQTSKKLLTDDVETSSGRKVKLEKLSTNSKIPSLGIKSKIVILGLLSATVWTIQFVNMSKDNSVTNEFSLIPRDTDHITGIFFMPLVHFNIVHLLFNWIPLLLTLIVMLSKGWTIVIMLLIFWFGGGGLLWCAGMPGDHAGLELVMMGMLVFMFGTGIKEKKAIYIADSFLCVVFLVVFVATLTSSLKGVTWDSLLLGAILGAIICFLYHKIDSLFNPRSES